MNKNKLLLIVIPLYFLQGTFFEPGGTFAKLLNIIWIFFIAYFAYRFFSMRGNDKIGKSLLFFWIYISISWILSPKVVISPEFGPFGTFGEYKNMTFALLTYFPITYLLGTGDYKSKDIVLFSYFSFISGIVYFFVKQISAINAQYWLENVTNNGGYMLVTMLPLMGIPLLFEKRIAFYLAMIISVVLVSFSVKRGAIVCLLVIILCFWYCVFYKETFKRKTNKLLLVFSSLLMLCLLFFGIYYVISTNEFLLIRINDMLEGDSSGRDEIAHSLFDSFRNSSLIEMLFGKGFSQTLSVAGLYAHNDWLELLIDQGIIGVLLYASLFKNMISFYFKEQKTLSPASKFIILSTILSWLARSTFSMGFSVPESCYYLIAFSSAKYLNQNKYATD